MIKTLLTIINLLFFFTLCKKTIIDENSISYIYVDKIKLVTNTTTQGSSSSKFEDAWVYVDNKLVGIYNLPSKIPIMKLGNYNLKIIPGILNGGISSQRLSMESIYTIYESNNNSIENNIDTINVQVEYNENVNIWKENFDDLGIKLFSDTSSKVQLISTNDINESFDNSKYGLAQFDINKKYMYLRTDDIELNKLKLYNRIILEMNYYTDINMKFGILHKKNLNDTYRRKEYMILTPTTSWNKIYIDLTEHIKEESGINFVNIYFLIDTYSGDALDKRVKFDNIKINYIE